MKPLTVTGAQGEALEELQQAKSVVINEPRLQAITQGEVDEEFEPEPEPANVITSQQPRENAKRIFQLLLRASKVN
eukprot:SAG31_NODE_1526_length_8004_cov_4.741176_6_plen_76_part_00